MIEKTIESPSDEKNISDALPFFIQIFAVFILMVDSTMDKICISGVESLQRYLNLSLRVYPPDLMKVMTASGERTNPFSTSLFSLNTEILEMELSPFRSVNLILSSEIRS